MLLLISPLSHRPTLHTKPPLTHTHTPLCVSPKQSLCLIFPFTFAFLYPFFPFPIPLEICAPPLITEDRYWVLFCILTTLAGCYSLLAYVIIKSLISRINTLSAVFQGFGLFFSPSLPACVVSSSSSLQKGGS